MFSDIRGRKCNNGNVWQNRHSWAAMIQSLLQRRFFLIMTTAKEAGGTPPVLCVRVSEWRQSPLDRENTSPLITSLPLGGEMKRPHTLAVPKWAQGKSGLHQTASTTLTHVASADALLVGKGSRLCNHSYRTHPCRPRSSSSSSSWYVESAHSKEKEKNKLGEKKIVNFAILLSVVLKSFNLQSQELEAVFLKVEQLDFVFHLLWSQWMIGVKWMCSRQALWTDCSLSVGQRLDSFRSRSDEAVPLLCLSLSFKGRGQEPWPHFLLGLLTSIPLSVRMRMGSGDAAHLAAVISNRLHPPPNHKITTCGGGCAPQNKVSGIVLFHEPLLCCHNFNGRSGFIIELSDLHVGVRDRPWNDTVEGNRL